MVKHVSRTTSDAETNSFIEFEKAPYYKGEHFLDPIAEAITQKQVLKMVYQKFDHSPSKSRSISPVLLKEYRNRWFVLGYDHSGGMVKTFGLDRIVTLTNCNEKYQMVDFDSATFFSNTLGIGFNDSKVELVMLRFDPYESGYLKTQHLHSTQRIIMEDEIGLTISLEVVLNYELKSLILSYGDKVEVLQPPALRQEVADIIRKCELVYSQPST